ncbi:MAG: hypothetical protein JST13_04710 [Bacteroidetes bacterium]|nr:hypothetical protein [Bacteroidota bacterium]
MPSDNQVYIYGTGNIADSLDIKCSPIGSSSFYRKYINLGNNVFQVTKLDTVNNIFSGTFSLTLYVLSGNNNQYRDSIIITDGRFDLKMGIQYQKVCSN